MFISLLRAFVFKMLHQKTVYLDRRTFCIRLSLVPVPRDPIFMYLNLVFCSPWACVCGTFHILHENSIYLDCGVSRHPLRFCAQGESFPPLGERACQLWAEEAAAAPGRRSPALRSPGPPLAPLLSPLLAAPWLRELPRRGGC